MANALTKIQTNALADDAVTLAKQAAGTDGQIITYDASGNPTAVGPGTDGQVLTSTGAGSPPAFEAIPAAGISDVVSDTTPQLGGNLDVNTKNIILGDSAGATDDRITFGAGTDLSIYHDASHSHLSNSTGNLNITNTGSNTIINADNITFQSGDQGETIARFLDEGACELWYDNSKKIETTTTGVTVTGNVKGTGVTLQQAWDSDVTYSTSRSGGAGYSDSNLGPVSITPKYSTSKLQITASQQYSLSGGTYNRGSITVWRSNDGGSNWSQVTFAPRDSNGTFLFGTGTSDPIKGYWTINFVNDASQTTEVQFKTMINCYLDGSIVVNETSNDVQRCWITVREYTP